MDDIYMGIGEVVDIHTWGDAVLWPALLQDTYPREPTDDDDVPHFRTPKELAEQMDVFDWTSGVRFLWQRVEPMDDSTCRSRMDKHHGLVLHNIRKHGFATDLERDTRGEGPPPNSRLHKCYPDLPFIKENMRGFTEGDAQATEPYGYNYSNPLAQLDHPFLWHDVDELGSNPSGQACREECGNRALSCASTDQTP